MNSSRVSLASRLVFLLAIVAGCSPRTDVQTAKVGGVVLFKGQPMKDVGVVFHPTEGMEASGKTDAEGKFRLSTRTPFDGAVIGEHRVTLVYADPNASYDAPPARSTIPRRYSSPGTSGLTAVVVAGEDNLFTFELEE